MDTDKLNVRATFLTQIVDAFNMVELHEIAFAVGVNFESLSGDTVPEKARELYFRLEREKNMHRLVRECKARRPKIEWAKIGD